MPLISWSDSLEVNIKEIDDQHKKLIGLLNSLFDAMKQARGREALGDILKEMADYTVYHFSAEESLLRACGYPEVEKHKEEHDYFTRRVMQFQEASNRGLTLITIEVLQFLTEWLRNHIMTVDKKYAPFVLSDAASSRRRGIKSE